MTFLFFISVLLMSPAVEFDYHFPWNDGEGTMSGQRAYTIIVYAITYHLFIQIFPDRYSTTDFLFVCGQILQNHFGPHIIHIIITLFFLLFLYRSELIVYELHKISIVSTHRLIRDIIIVVFRVHAIYFWSNVFHSNGVR